VRIRELFIPVENISQWERTSLSLKVSDPYRHIFQNFSNYFKSEMGAIQDNTLGQELDVINRLGHF
jgi:hypothetical protein